MKHVLLLLLLVPQLVFAYREDPRVRKEAPYARVKAVKKTTYFTLPKEGNKLDTAIVESEFYNEDGLLIQHDYVMVLPKNPPYSYQEKLIYNAEDAWVKEVRKHGVLTDSIVVNGSLGKWYFFKARSPYALYEYRLDSMQEKMINGGDTIYRPTKANAYFNRDDFWDYTCGAAFDKKTSSSDKDGSTTVSYLNAKGVALAGYTEKRIAGGKVYEVDYYNYNVKQFVFKRLTYSESMEMVFFLKKSKKGNWSYRIQFTYNDKGQLIEEKWIDPNPKKNQVVIKYEYMFY
jgi:hypothetical protein